MKNRAQVSVRRITVAETGDISHCEIDVGGKVLVAPLNEPATKLRNRVEDETGVQLETRDVMAVWAAAKEQLLREGKRLEQVLSKLPEGAVANIAGSSTHYWLSADGELLWSQTVPAAAVGKAEVCPRYIDDITEIDTDELTGVAEELRQLALNPTHQVRDIDWLRGCETIHQSAEALAEEKAMVIYSPNEAALSGDGAGFWNDEMGWVTLEDASRYTREQAAQPVDLMSTGNDHRWCEAADFEFSQDASMEP